MKKHLGFSLLELMLVLTFIVIASGVAYKIFKPSQIQAAVRQEQQNVGRMVDAIMGAYSTASSFSTLSSATAAGILNLPMNGSELNSALHKNLTVQPATTLTANDSFDLTYAALSTQQCQSLIPALASRSQGVFVGNNSNLQDARGNITNESLIATQCAASSTTNVTFRFRADKNTFAATSMNSCLCAPETETQTLACPSGSGSITQRRTGTCTGGTPVCPTTQWSSWVTASNTCAANATPVAPQVPVAPNNTCGASTEYQTLTCPSGQTGSVVQYRTQSCTTNAWSAWTDLQNSCRPVVNMGTCEPETKREYFNCPNGQGGQIYAEFATQCDSNGNTISADESVLSNWKIINSNCTASCVRNGNCCTVTRRPIETTTTQCAVGSYGPGVTTRRQQSSSCPTHDGPAVWNDSGWSSVGTPTGQCNACTPNQTTQAVQWVARTASCPAGQTGELVYSDEQVQDVVTTRLCNSQAGVLNDDATTSVSAWRNTGNTTVTTNTCAALPTNECAVPGSYTITSVSAFIRAGNNTRTVNPYALGQLQSTPGNANNDNMEFEGTVTGISNGVPFTGTVRASQTPTIRGSGSCYAMQANGNPNAALYSCGGAGMPAGLDLSVFMAGNSQAQMSITSRPCGGGGGSANITTGNLWVYRGVGFISTGNAPAGQTTLVASAQTAFTPALGPLTASYSNYAITFNGVTRTVLSGSCSVPNLSVAQNCTSEQTVDFNGRPLVIRLSANVTGSNATAQVHVTPQ